jgi:predicted anti-sigma-YlaC factor YlaD
MTCREFASSVTEYLERALPIRQSADFEEHRATCSNCQVYFEQMNQLIRAAPALSHEIEEAKVPQHLYELLAKRRSMGSVQQQPKKLAYRLLIFAAFALAVLAGLWLYRTHNLPQPGPVAVTIDLTERGQTRGLEQRTQPPIELPRAKLDLTVEMPIGALPGKYEVGVASEHGSPTVTATGSAALINHVTTLHVTLDLTKYRSGSYRFAARPVSWDWAYYPLRIK